MKLKRLWALLLCACLLTACVSPGVTPSESDFSPTESATSTTTQPRDDATVTTVPTKDSQAVGVAPRLLKAAASLDGYNFSFDDYRQNAVGAGIPTFYQKAMEQLLVGEAGENRVCSPLNLYVALALLAETTAGESRQEILHILGETDIAILRKKVKILCDRTCSTREEGTFRVANSVWMDDDLPTADATLARLASDYYASSYVGDLSSAASNAALQQWLNEQTDGFLADAVKNTEFTPDTVLSLVSTVYFGGRWESGFSKFYTKQETFHAATGDVTADFMHKTKTDRVYRGEGYKAMSLPLGGEYAMLLLLPDEDVSVNTLLKSGAAFTAIKGLNTAADYEVSLALPRFDVSREGDLKADLQAMGVNKVFDAAKADFGSVIQGAEAGDFVVTTAKNAVRVAIDEEGCTAAAFTKFDMKATSAKPPEYEKLAMTFDRPFVFCLTGVSNEMLFAGVIETP